MNEIPETVYIYTDGESKYVFFLQVKNYGIAIFGGGGAGIIFISNLEATRTFNFLFLFFWKSSSILINNCVCKV